VDADVRLRAEPVPIPPQTMPAYLRTVVLGAHLDRRSPEAAEELVREVAARLPDGVIDYVRLEISARLG
jgi:trans-aconitate 2-methyltransferase